MNYDDENDTLDEEFVIEFDENTDETAGIETTQEAEKEEPEAKEDQETASAESEGVSTQAVDKEDLSDEDRQKLGNRAQKRIQRLVRQRKEVEEKNAALESRLSELEHNAREFDVRSRRGQVASLKQHTTRLEAQEAQVKQAYKNARESGDIDGEVEANDALATIKAEQMLVTRAMQQAEANVPSQENVEDRRPVQTDTSADTATAPKPDPKAKAWQRQNMWFGGDTRKEKFMTQEALDIHDEIVAEGISPVDDTEEYYAELDRRVRTEFPDEFKDSSGTKSSPVVGGRTRSAGSGKRTIKLSKSEVARAKRLGTTPEAYAREKAKIAART